MDASFALLDFVNDALSLPENFSTLRGDIERKCGALTLRAKVLKKQKEEVCVSSSDCLLHIYKVELSDVFRKGYLVVKGLRGKKIRLLDGANYVLDQVKLVVNKKGEVLLMSSRSTVIREEEDTFEVESLELSQREEECNREEPKEFIGAKPHAELAIFVSTRQIV